MSSWPWLPTRSNSRSTSPELGRTKSASVLVQDVALDGFGEALLSIGLRDPARAALHVLARLPHRDAQAAVREHQHVIRHVADGRDGVERNVELAGEPAHHGALVRIG